MSTAWRLACCRATSGCGATRGFRTLDTHSAMKKAGPTARRSRASIGGSRKARPRPSGSTTTSCGGGAGFARGSRSRPVDDALGHVADLAGESASDTAIVNASTPTERRKRYYRVYRSSLFHHFRLDSTPALSQFVKTEFADEDIEKEGWLGQRGSFSRTWKLRYFILRRDTSSLVCLRDRASLVQISEAPIDRHTSLLTEESPNDHQFQFLVINGQHKLRLNAVDATSRAAWLSSLSELIVLKRASFLATEDNEGSVHGGTSDRGFRNTLRRMASSRTDDGLEWYTPVTTASITESKLGATTGTPGCTWNVVKRRRVWRPYRLVSSTMLRKDDVDRLSRKTYLEAFELDFTNLLGVAKSFLKENLEVLEGNLFASEALFTAVVAKVPENEIKRLIHDVDDCMQAIEDRFRRLLESSTANVLQCNMLRRLLFVETKRMNDTIKSFDPPATQLTVKRKTTETASARRIPTDWYIEPVVAKEVPRIPIHVVVTRESSGSSTANDLSVRFPDRPGRRKRNSDASVADSSRTSVSSGILSSLTVGSNDRLLPRGYQEFPQALCEGHLELPSGVNDYVVLIHERDLGALIAFTLCSHEYAKMLESHFGGNLKLDEELSKEESTTGEDPGVAEDGQNMSNPTERIYLEKLRSNDVQHTEVKFSCEIKGAKHDFRCVSFFAAQFHSLRALLGRGNTNFLCSIAQSRRWEASGGKSGAFFSMTHDSRYILKGIPVTELNMFLHMAPSYFKFMSRVIESAPSTVITKILGLYKVTHNRRLHKHTTYVVVMENLAYGFPPGQIYDIKGITRRRFTVPSDEETDGGSETGMSPCRQPSMNAGPVLLDGNLMERIPIPVRKTDLDVIESAIQNDTNFLARAGVIDYSLLMIFDEENRQIIVGLIDYLHQFDFLKKMESTSKASLTFRDPTIISPHSYQRRFVNAMHRYLVGIELELELRIRKRAHQRKLKREALEQALQGAKSAEAAIARVRSASDRGQRDRDVVYDRDAAVAHSDGEEYGSVSSDETCLRESRAVISSLMPDDDR
ncbi:hypothetical protein PINS_up008093 [Pythium insidiosum]|nr:hypothetical protein PINS_up008093 [Pythium insidiosum]